MHSLGIVQWNSTRRDHPGNPGGVSGSGLVMYDNTCQFLCKSLVVQLVYYGQNIKVRCLIRKRINLSSC